MPNEDETTPSDDTETPPIEVVDKTPKTKQWNDSKEDFEYDEHQITDKEIEEHDNT